MVKSTVKIPMVITPHLIGKQAQHEEPTVYSLEQTQRQQQHGVVMCSFGIDSWVASDFLEPDFLDFSDFGFSSLGSSPISGFSSSAAAAGSAGGTSSDILLLVYIVNIIIF